MSAAAHASLQQQQQALLRALFARPRSDSAALARQKLDALLDTHSEQSDRGLMAYTANGHALAERTLLTAYPVIAALLGGENFTAIARDLWHRHPPTQGDLAQWGDALPHLLASGPTLIDEAPYLADVARTEWALHCAAGAADAVPDLPSFARLANENPEGLALTLAPGTAVVRSRHPVATLVMAHLYPQPSLAEAAGRLREGVPENALVWRNGLKPQVAGCSSAAALLIESLLAGGDLPQALDASIQTGAQDASPFDFSSWLNDAVTHGLVIGVHSLAHASTTTLTPAPAPAPEIPS
jgi:hypothetical protein